MTAHDGNAMLSASEVANRDLRALMLILGMSIHARPNSPQEVFQSEVLPKVAAMQDALAEVAQSAVYSNNGDDTYTITGTVYDTVRTALNG